MSDADEAAERPAAGDLSGELVAVARAVRVRGLRGEVVADLLTDFPERFEALTELIAVRPDGRREALELEEHWFQANRVIFKFSGYDTVEAAQGLVGCELAVPEAESVELPDDEFYHWQLEGCRVETLDGRAAGRVREVLETGGVPVLVITGEDGREHLIPLAAEICVEIDITRQLIRVDPPEGLIEV